MAANAAATNATHILKKGKKEAPGNYRLVSLTIIPGKMVEQPILETISRHTKDKNMIRRRQHGFTKGKSCLMNLIAFAMKWFGMWGESSGDTQKLSGHGAEQPALVGPAWARVG